LFCGNQLQDPRSEAAAPFDLAAQAGVIEVTMGVDQARREHAFTQVALLHRCAPRGISEALPTATILSPSTYHGRRPSIGGWFIGNT